VKQSSSVFYSFVILPTAICSQLQYSSHHRHIRHLNFIPVSSRSLLFLHYLGDDGEKETSIVVRECNTGMLSLLSYKYTRILHSERYLINTACYSMLYCMLLLFHEERICWNLFCVSPRFINTKVIYFLQKVESLCTNIKTFFSF